MASWGILSGMKVAAITCYAHPDYVRAVTIRRALQDQPNTKLFVVKNRHKGLLRYPEVTARLIWTRLRHRPDVYVLTFRAYEILPVAALLTWPKKLVFDEFLNPLEWLREDRKEWWAKLVPQRLLIGFYRLLLKRCALVLEDTDAHAQYSSQLLGVPHEKFIALPVGTDEKLFKPKQTAKSKDFSVFYYGSMLPLHGLDVVLAAAERLKDKPIRFVFAGGDKHTVAAVAAARNNGANIDHHAWIPFEKLADTARESHLTLGGPFGDTPQARMVVTGKTYQFLACGAPVLVGKTKASDDFKHKINCLMTPLGDSAAIAEQILWAYEHPKELERIAQAGHQLYTDMFSSKALAHQMSMILQKL